MLDKEAIYPTTIHCIDCGNRMVITDWKPPDGHNPLLRQYVCQGFRCEAIDYRPIHKRISTTPLAL